VSSRGWLVVWFLASIVFCAVANLYTGSTLLDVTIGHAIIAGFVGLIVTSVCFGIVESVSFVVGLFRARNS